MIALVQIHFAQRLAWLNAAIILIRSTHARSFLYIYFGETFDCTLVKDICFSRFQSGFPFVRIFGKAPILSGNVIAINHHEMDELHHFSPSEIQGHGVLCIECASIWGFIVSIAVKCVLDIRHHSIEKCHCFLLISDGSDPIQWIN